MKNACFFLSFFITSLVAAQLPKLYKEVSSSVVVLNVESLEPASLGQTIKMVRQDSQGSGVLVSKEGHIWTASHVVQSAESVSVEFIDGSTYDAEVLLSNPLGDVALLKITGNFDPEDKAIAEIGDSDQVEIGEDIVVLGAPHGFKQTLTRGIISGRYTPENLSNEFERIEFFQTDAAINPGNSGGPMFNLKGEVIGISSSIYSISGGFEGIGFVATSNVVKSLLESGPSLWTGIESMLLTPEMAKVLNVPQESGLLILAISSKGAAAKLGLRGGYLPATLNGEEVLLGGDVILEIAGIKFVDQKSRYQIKQKIASFAKGDAIPIVILREGQIGSATVEKQ